MLLSEMVSGLGVIGFRVQVGEHGHWRCHGTISVRRSSPKP